MDGITRNIIIEDRFKGFIPLFSAIANIQDGLFCTQLLGSININFWEKYPMCVYLNPYNEMNHHILLLSGSDTFQAVYQFSHEYSHIKMKFWKTYNIKEYKFKFLEEAIAYCASIVSLFALSFDAQEAHSATLYPPEAFKEYALDNLKKVILLSPPSLPAWLKENFPEPLGSDFCCDSEQSGERERSKILGHHLIQFASDHGFWKAASMLTEACASNPQAYPTTIEELFERWIPFCSPDAAKAISDVRSTLICTC